MDLDLINPPFNLAGVDQRSTSQTEGEFLPKHVTSAVRELPSLGLLYINKARGGIQVARRVPGKPGLALVPVENLDSRATVSAFRLGSGVRGVNMTWYRVLSVVFVPICWALVSGSKDANQTATGGTTTTNSSLTNSTHSGGKSHGGLSNGFIGDSWMIQRALYVLIAITMIGVLYFLIRAVRLKKPGQKKKYGLLSNYDDSVEMDAVESDEDDTLYEARSLRR